MRRFVWLFAVLSFALTGCSKEESAPPVAALLSTEPTEAQPRLPTVNLNVGRRVLVTEIARTERQMAAGMMFRKSMTDDEGMLFVFPTPRRASFYMRNTTVALSCAYLDSAGVIREIYDMKPLEENPIISKSDQIRYCLEVPQGWFQRHNVPIGTGVATDRGTLNQAFFSGR